MPPETLFSGRTAAWLHGLEFAPCEPIEITLPQLSTTSHLAGARLTRSDCADREVCEVRGLPATTPARTPADICRRRVLTDAVVILDMALRAGLVTLDDLRVWIDDHPRHRGIGRLERAIFLADAASESPMETRLRVLLVTDGLPRPYVQKSLFGPDGSFIARPDLFYADARLVIEYDGVGHRDRLAADNRRQNRIVEAGHRVLRYAAGDILHWPAAVVDEVRRALGYSSSGSPN